MQPLGVLAGRVLDQYGNPVHHAIVRTEDKMTVPGQDQYDETYSAAFRTIAANTGSRKSSTESTTGAEALIVTAPTLSVVLPRSEASRSAEEHVINDLVDALLQLDR